MREIKFRAWDKENNEMISWETLVKNHTELVDLEINPERFIFQQFTGLCDKNGQEIYEGDIVRAWHFEAGGIASDGAPYGDSEHGTFDVEITGVVFFKQGSFFIDDHGAHFHISCFADIVEENQKQSYDTEYEYCGFEVIGDVHTNTELLEAK